MTEARITSRGRITIPQSIRKRMKVHTGDTLEFIEDKGGYRIEKVLPGITKWSGYFKHLGGQDPDGIVKDLRSQYY